MAMDLSSCRAFFRMRSNGAYLADVVLLIIACDEGVKPQTQESYALAKESALPVVIALNKIDLPVDTEKVKQNLTQLGWVPPSARSLRTSRASPPSNVKAIVEISAKEKRNLDVLVSTLSQVAKQLNLWADTTCPLEATVVEAWCENGARGRVLKLIPHCGVLRVGQHFVVGYQAGRVRAIFNENRKVDEALPGEPVEIVGLYGNMLPAPGDDLFAVSREKAEEVVQFRELVTEFQSTQGKYDRALIDSIHREPSPQRNHEEEDEEEDEGEESKNADEATIEQQDQDQEKEIHLVLKADNIGSLHTLIDAFNELTEQGHKINVIRAGVGNVNATDVAFAIDGQCPIYTFNVDLSHDVKAKRTNFLVPIKSYNVFYHLLDDIKNEGKKRK